MRKAPSLNAEINELRKEGSLLKTQVITMQRHINNLIKQNKYLNDRIRAVEHKSNFFDRAITQMQNTIDRISRIFK